MDVELINWVKDGPYRIRALRLLSTQPLLSSELATRLDVNRASMSRILRGLKKRNLVSTVSAKSRTVTYVLSGKGSEVLKALEIERNEAT